MTTRGPQDSARIALACLDLTSLNDGDTAQDIEHLCTLADGDIGPVAAVCVWPRFAALARARLPGFIRVAAVANFPAGGVEVAAAVADTRSIVDAGAQEVDVVLPHAALRAGDTAACTRLLEAVRAACDGLRLKVILESGLLDPTQLALASRIALDAGADFLKTSTGKVATGATLPAARGMLQAIASHPQAATRVGFKCSGGVRTVADATGYMGLVQDLLGAAALGPDRFRIGASGLLADIRAVLTGGAAPSTRDGY